MFRYSVDELNKLLEIDLGRKRNRTRTWKTINAERELSKAIFEATGGIEGHKEELMMIKEAMERQQAHDDFDEL